MSDHGSRGWEATPTGWRCTECHGEVVGPVDVHIDDAHVCQASEWDAGLRKSLDASMPDWTAFTPPPTREPIRLTAEAEAEAAREVAHAAWAKWILSPEGRNEIPEPQVSHQEAFISGFHAARLAGGPTLADARTPESEDTE